jgi:hypothetical protein
MTNLHGPGWDCETWLIRPGKLAPEMVCLSVAAWDGVWLYHRNDAYEPLTLLGTAAPPARTAKKAFRWVLRQPVSYGLNVAYDVAVCLALWPDLFEEVFEAYDNDRIIDVGLSQRLIDIAKGKLKFMQARWGYSLAGLEHRLLKRDRSGQKTGPDIWRLRYRELDDVPLKKWPREAADYAAEDAIGARDLGEYQWNSEDRKYLLDSPAQARAALSLQLMQCWGVMTDPEKIKILDTHAQEKYWNLSYKLAKPENDRLVRGTDVIQRNLQWTKDVKAAKRRMVQVCQEQGLSVKLTTTGYKKYVKYLKDNGVEDDKVFPEEVLSGEEIEKYASVDEDACRRTGDEILMDFSLRSQMHSIIRTHVEDLEKGVVTPIQPRYTVLVDSGRTACSKSRSDEGKRVRSSTNGFQFQNPKRAYTWIPPGEKKAVALFPPGVGIRECFISRPNKLFGDNDFSGLELCTGAQACKDLVGYSKLADALNAGLDPHLDFGATLMGISYNDALKNKHDKEVKFYRQLAKIFNFGAPGGLGKRGIVAFARGYGVILNEEQAKQYKSDWLFKYPEWNDYFNWIRSQLELDLEELDSDSETEAIARVVGTFEQLRVGRFRGRCKFTEACNTFFQGLGADVSKRAMWGVTKRCYMQVPGSVLYGVRPVGFIHDEILAEVDIDMAHEQAYEMAQVMCDEGNVLLPDVPVKCEPALSKHWCKEAEAVFDKSGRLQPYDLAREGRWEVYFDQHAEFRVNWG